MALIARELIKRYNYVFTDLRDPRLDDHFLMSSPLPILLIVAVYMYFVKSLGPRLMRDRPPFKLDRLIQVYDIIQIGASLHVMRQGYKLLGGYSWTCEPVDYSNSPEALEIADGSHFYFVVKVLDFMDTIFFVLRKKNRQISFLHVYHHAMMAVGTWFGVKFVGGGHSVVMGVLNSCVHAVMYSYYLLTSVYPEQKKNIWWKKHITQIQMVQFVLIMVHSGQVLLQPKCNYPHSLSLLVLSQNAFMLTMFYDFYCRTYHPSTNRATTPSDKTD